MADFPHGFITGCAFATILAIVVTCARAERVAADTTGPGDAFHSLICDPITGAPVTLAPQRHGEIITYDQGVGIPGLTIIQHPGLGTDGSGGHSPHADDAPTPIWLGAAATYAGGGIGMLVALALRGRRRVKRC